MFCRQVFGNISCGFRGISRFWGNFAGFRGSATARNIRSPVYNSRCEMSHLLSPKHTMGVFNLILDIRVMFNNDSCQKRISLTSVAWLYHGLWCTTQCCCCCWVFFLLLLFFFSLWPVFGFQLITGSSGPFFRRNSVCFFLMSKVE